MRSATLSVVVLAACVSSCAPRTVVVAPAMPAFPDFVFPGLPAGYAEPALTSQHQQAWNLLQSRDLDRAAREFSAVLERSPGFYPAESGLGYVALARRDQAVALAQFDRALAIAPGYASALAGRGQTLLGLGRDDEALATFEAALAADANLAAVRERVDVLKFRAVQDRVAEARQAASVGQLDAARAAYERAISASPDSPLLYREIAAVEQRQGSADRALEYARKAVDVDRSDARSWILLGDLLESAGDLKGAIEALTAAAAAEPSLELTERLAVVRARADLARLPPEYRAIAGAVRLTRGDLAALVGVKLPDLIQHASRRDGVVMTDGRDHWAAPWIQEAVRAGVMEVYANHTFQPAALVTRSHLAQAVNRLLDLVAGANPALAVRWQGVRPRIADVASEHLDYPAASAAIASGVIDLLPGEVFDLSRPVSGDEAILAVDRIAELASAYRVSPAPR